MCVHTAVMPQGRTFFALKAPTMKNRSFSHSLIIILLKMCNEKKLAFFGALFQIIGLPLQPILKTQLIYGKKSSNRRVPCKG